MITPAAMSARASKSTMTAPSTMTAANTAAMIIITAAKNPSSASCSISEEAAKKP
jgi:hypothetical protein